MHPRQCLQARAHVPTHADRVCLGVKWGNSKPRVLPCLGHWGPGSAPRPLIPVLSARHRIRLQAAPDGDDDSEFILNFPCYADLGHAPGTAHSQEGISRAMCIDVCLHGRSWRLLLQPSFRGTSQKEIMCYIQEDMCSSIGCWRMLSSRCMRQTKMPDSGHPKVRIPKLARLNQLILSTL